LQYIGNSGTLAQKVSIANIANLTISQSRAAKVLALA